MKKLLKIPVSRAVGLSLLAISLLIMFWLPSVCLAMPPGTLLYRTSSQGKMFGYSSDPLLNIQNGVLKDVYAGHAALYIGQENGEDYVVEATAQGVVKTPAKYFVNSANGEVFLGAKLPAAATPLQIAKAVSLAKTLVGERPGYDFDFKTQKGPGDGQWTCSGLLEKLYESADSLNPNDLSGLEYNQDNYAVDITPDGFDNYSIMSNSGDCFSRDKEFSKIARRPGLLIPAPELIGYDLGLEYNGDRYIFLPYTQFLQPTLKTVEADITLSSSFSDPDIRGPLDMGALVLRWSLINNPLSSLARVFTAVKDWTVAAGRDICALAKNISDKIFGSGSGTALVLDDSALSQKIGSSTTGKASGGSAGSAKSGKPSAAAGQADKSSPAGSLPAVVVNKAKPGTTVKNQSLTTGQSTGPNPVKTAGTSSSTQKSNNLTAQTAATKTGSNKTVSTGNQTATALMNYYAPAVSSASPSTGGGGGGPVADNWPKLAKINRIYATGDDDWIELINPTDHDFDLAAAGYRLEKTKTASDPSLIMRLGDSDDGTYPHGTVIKAHSRYLIASSAAKAYYLSRADAIATGEGFGWSGSGYTIYLGVGAITSNTDPDIVDAVGFGPDATYFQGAAPATEITDNHILTRTGDQGDNQKDFILSITDDPSFVMDNVTSDNEATSSAATSTTTTATSTTSTSTEEIVATSTEEVVATSTEVIDESVTSTDGGLATSTEITGEATTTPINEPNNIFINKIYATDNNDWLELHNFGTTSVDLAVGNYRLEKTVTAQDPDLIIRFGDLTDGLYPGGTIIPAGGNYLVVRDQASDFYRHKAQAIATRTDFSWTGSGYTLYLGNGPISSSTDVNIQDLIGYGQDATYFQGDRPALAINDGFILNRIGNSGDNYADFNLIPTDDPNFVPADSAGDSAAGSNLFVAPTPIDSPGLSDLWHFDECYGGNDYVIGRWDCARSVGVFRNKIPLSLSQPLDLNSFSLSLNYKKTVDYPRASWRLFSSDNSSPVRLILEPDMITVEGLPNSQWRYYVSVPFDDSWHQATLVVNQAEDYWAVYLDGREIVKETFLARLGRADNLELSGDCAVTLVDEVAVWSRSLVPAEIANDYESAAPYAPLLIRSPQLAARNLHLWRFEEDQGAVAQDSLGNSTITVPSTGWTGRAHDNYALRLSLNQKATADLNWPLSTQDLSLAFWYRNGSYPNPGRINVNLLGGADGQAKLFSLLADYFRPGYFFNRGYGAWSAGENQTIPYDDAWHHLAMTYDSYRYRLHFYVDGEERASSSLIWMKPEETINRLEIYTDSYPAEIDDLGLYEGTLTSKQVKDIFINTR